ncbi:MAG: hypothetical protein SFU99_07515 [Saprospiraceae bacterium]|nr:hypothetical protein [Saprospiraceae bacterium]
MSVKKFLIRLVQGAILMVLPFMLLIRVAVLMYEHYHFRGWFCLLIGSMISAAILFTYLYYFQERFFAKTLNYRQFQRNYAILLGIVILYCINSTWSVSIANVKEMEVKQEFKNLHPILRLSISTLILFEKDIILTDAERKREDYREMGLPSKKYSLHYEQSSGYAHAVDIRTKGHSWLRNKLIQAYFELMGFNTLIHKGTAEHLHVSLSSVDSQGI